jgi:hypothetical protein
MEKLDWLTMVYTITITASYVLVVTIYCTELFIDNSQNDLRYIFCKKYVIPLTAIYTGRTAGGCLSQQACKAIIRQTAV